MQGGGPFLWVKQGENQSKQGGLAFAGRTDQSNDLMRMCGKIRMLKYLCPIMI